MPFPSSPMAFSWSRCFWRQITVNLTISGVDYKNDKCLSVRCLEVDGIIISSATYVHSQRPRFFPIFCFSTISILAFIFHLVPAGCKMAPSYPHKHQKPEQGQRKGIQRAFSFWSPCLLSGEIIFPRKSIGSWGWVIFIIAAV